MPLSMSKFFVDANFGAFCFIQKRHRRSLCVYVWVCGKKSYFRNLESTNKRRCQDEQESKQRFWRSFHCYSTNLHQIFGWFHLIPNGLWIEYRFRIDGILIQFKIYYSSKLLHLWIYKYLDKSFNEKQISRSQKIYFEISVANV